ncbi:MAG: transposase [Candidatus Marinimicrobia bacterium]|nr:transposase [Candidatus Neomarinimicrobiota bacterium]
MRHRNTRRRPYRRFGYYFITTNVSEGFTILDQYEYGHLLEHIIFCSASIHSSQVIAFKINSDHVHLVAQIGEFGTISEYVASWKRQFSKQVNILIARMSSPGQDSNPGLVTFNKFRWQPSYHSHLITSKRDFENHINYILKQKKHHDLEDNKFCFVDHKHVFTFK